MHDWSLYVSPMKPMWFSSMRSVDFSNWLRIQYVYRTALLCTRLFEMLFTTGYKKHKTLLAVDECVRVRSTFFLVRKKEYLFAHSFMHMKLTGLRSIHFEGLNIHLGMALFAFLFTECSMFNVHMYIFEIKKSYHVHVLLNPKTATVFEFWVDYFYA